MPKLLPRLYDGFLQGDGVTVRVDSQEWFDWLRANKSFAVEMPNCRVTFRKEQRHDKEFWYAHRRVNGKLKRKYAGHTGVLFNNYVTGLARGLAMDNSDGDGVTQGKSSEAIAPKETEVDALRREIASLKSKVEQLTDKCLALETENTDLRTQAEDTELHKDELHKTINFGRSEEIEAILTPALKLPANRGGKIKEAIRQVLAMFPAEKS